jgi:hypothetical protein
VCNECDARDYMSYNEMKKSNWTKIFKHLEFNDENMKAFKAYCEGMPGNEDWHFLSVEELVKLWAEAYEREVFETNFNKRIDKIVKDE